jgi:ankyrin repeat protein
MRRGWKHFIWAGAFLCASLIWGKTPVPELSVAVKAGDVGAVHALLNQHADVNATEPDGTTALHWAVRASGVELTELLVRSGANVNAVNRYGITPLSLAASEGSAPVLGILLKAGASVQRAEASLPDGEKLLLLAARTGSVEAIQALANSGADVNATEPRTGTTVAHVGGT